jgi:hypothetical protein
MRASGPPASRGGELKKRPAGGGRLAEEAFGDFPAVVKGRHERQTDPFPSLEDLHEGKLLPGCYQVFPEIV